MNIYKIFNFFLKLNKNYLYFKEEKLILGFGNLSFFIDKYFRCLCLEYISLGI